MKIFFIILSVILVLILSVLLLSLLLFLIGKARIRIIYKDRLKIFLTVLGIRFRILPKKDKPMSAAAKRRAEKRALKKKRKKQEKTGIPSGLKPGIPDILDMIFSLLRLFYEKTRGKLSIRMRCFKLRIATDDPAKTAIVYGASVGIISGMMQWIQKKFNPIDRKPGEMQVYPDYLAAKPDIAIDIELGMRLHRAVPVALDLLKTYEGKKETALRKAASRKKEKEARKRRKQTTV